MDDNQVNNRKFVLRSFVNGLLNCRRDYTEREIKLRPSHLHASRSRELRSIRYNSQGRSVFGTIPLLETLIH